MGQDSDLDLPPSRHQATSPRGQKRRQAVSPKGREKQIAALTAPHARGGRGGVGKLNSPARMSYLLDKLCQWPHVNHACAAAGMNYGNLQYWLRRSRAGKPGDGFDLEYGGELKRFHEHYADARDAAVQLIEDEYMQRAWQGYYEVLHDKGRVIYQQDPDLVALGMTGPDAYLRDKNGAPIPERIHHQDPEVMLEVLRQWRRDRWGAKSEVDVSVRGGVLVVDVRARDSKDLEQQEKDYLSGGPVVDVPFEEVENE